MAWQCNTLGRNVTEISATAWFYYVVMTTEKNKNTKRQHFSTDAAKIIWQFKSSDKSQQKSNTALQGLFKCMLATEPSLLQNWENVWQGIHRKGQKPLQLEITLFIEAVLWIICCVERHLHAKTQPSSLQQPSLGSVCAGLWQEFSFVQSGNQVKLPQSIHTVQHTEPQKWVCNWNTDV